jgi:hypothetical protein
MEDVLAVYMRPHDPRPKVCLDETSKQLIVETRVPIPMKPGRVARVDYEYERNGTANLFMLFAPLEGWRHVKVTDRHTAIDYAHVPKDLADIHFPRELGVLSTQCLDRRIPDKQTLIDEIAAWWQQRNANHTKSDWQFTTKNARTARWGRDDASPRRKQPLPALVKLAADQLPTQPNRLLVDHAAAHTAQTAHQESRPPESYHRTGSSKRFTYSDGCPKAAVLSPACSGSRNRMTGMPEVGALGVYVGSGCPLAPT